MKNFIIGTLIGTFAGMLVASTVIAAWATDSKSDAQIIYKNDLRMRERNAFKDGARSYAAGEGVFMTMDTGEEPEKWMTNKVDNSIFRIKE